MADPYDTYGLIGGHAYVMAHQMIDSTLETTRVFWRKKFFGATDEQAKDPRPFAEVLAEGCQTKGNALYNSLRSTAGAPPGL